jgi:phosphatidate phosphatase PAH1
VIAVESSEGVINASPFAVQFGKKDIWLPRSGHQVTVTVNSLPAATLAMVLDSTGTAYFPTQEQPGGRQYRFWTALLGMGEPAPQHRTNSASSSQLAALELRPGANSIEYEVETKSGSMVRTSASIHLINSTARLVVSDIDGTVTKSNVRGFVLPVLGLSDWKHQGVVELYSKIADQGYTIMFLTNR